MIGLLSGDADTDRTDVFHFQLTASILSLSRQKYNTRWKE